MINKQETNNNKAVSFYEIAKIKMKSDISGAINLIEKALTLKKNFPPYIKLYLTILFSINDKKKIQKILKKYWNEIPSPLLRRSITDVLKENKINDINFVKNFIYKNSNDEESKKLLIDFAIYFNEWTLARENIKGLIGQNTSKEMCLFRSARALGEFNDIKKSTRWKLS